MKKAYKKLIKTFAVFIAGCIGALVVYNLYNLTGFVIWVVGMIYGTLIGSEVMEGS